MGIGSTRLLPVPIGRTGPTLRWVNEVFLFTHRLYLAIVYIADYATNTNSKGDSVGIQVVEQASKIDENGAEAVVVIESDEVRNFGLAIEELNGAGAKQLACQWASSKGLAPAACKPHGAGAYPINGEGLSLELVVDEATKQPLPPQHPRMQPARYRVDVPVARRLI